MIVVIRPGGTVSDVNVVLKHDELLPARYNTKSSIVYREAEGNSREWILVKPRHSVLPPDSSLLSEPTLPEVLTSVSVQESSESLYDHVDIIRFEEEKK